MIELNRTLLFQILNFLVLMGLLYFFLFKPIQRFLTHRSESIHKVMEDAEASRQESQKKLSEYSQLLSQAQKEIEILKDAAKREVSEERRQTLKEAKEEARRLIDEAKEEIEGEVGNVRFQLRAEVVELATVLAEKVIKKSLREEDQHRLIQDTLEHMGEKD